MTTVPDPATTDWVPMAGGAFVPVSTIDAAGDLLVGTGADALQRLPKGANGQVLTARAAAPGVGWATPDPPPIVAYGASLPASPVDGQEAILVNDPANPAYQWRFRYNAGSSHAEKWEFIGGSDDGGQIFSGTLPANAAGDLGPAITLPRTGLYKFSAGVTGGVTYVTGAYGVMYINIDGGNAAAAVSGVVGNWASGDPNVYLNMAIPTLWAGPYPAGTVAKLTAYAAPVEGYINFASLTVTPVRVS